MKRRILLAAIATILMAFAFVSCSGNVEAPEDRLGTISLGDNSRAVTTVVKYSSEVENLVWFYKATKLDDGYTTGDTNDKFVAVAKATGSSGNYKPTTGLSGKTLDGVFSYGLWKIELEGYKYETEEGGTKNVTVDESGTVAIAEGKSPEYTSTIDNHLVDKGATYATAKIEVGENAETKIVFDSVNGISFTSGNIKSTSSFTLAVTDSLSGSDINVSTADVDVAKADGSVTFKNITYTVPDGTDITGDHTMNFVLSQELKNNSAENTTENITIEAALYTLKFTVKKGTTTTISGTILKNDKTGTIQIDSFQDVEPITVSRALDVKEIGTTADTAVVKTEKTITVGSMSVTYPKGALISTSTDGVTVEDETGKTGTADAEQGIVRNDAAETNTITIGASESKETYELTLASSKTATKENSALVKVEFFYGKNREVSTVYHNGVEIVEYTNQTDVETYSYDSESGTMTLRLFHASPITIVTKQAVAEVAGKEYFSLGEAITAASSNGTVKLIRPLEISEEVTVSSSITLDLARNAISLKDNGSLKLGENAVLTVMNSVSSQESFVTAGARIGSSSSVDGTYYYSLNEAVENVTDGSNIYLLKDVGTVTEKDKSVYLEVGFESEGGTLDLGGKTIYGSLVIGSTSSSDPKTLMTIKNGTVDSKLIKQNGGYINRAAVEIWKPSTVIESGKFNGDNAVLWVQVQGVYDTTGKQVYEYISDNMTTLTIDGGTFVATGYGSCICNSMGKTVINGGVFSADENGDIFYISSGTDKNISRVLVNNGEFTSSGKLITLETKPSSSTNIRGEIEIFGGIFKYSGALVAWNDGCPDGLDAKDYVKIYGGTFSSDPTDYVVNGYEAVKNEGSGTWTVQESKN